MKYLTNSGLSYFFNKIKTYIAAQLNSKANLTHTHSASDITSGLATVATSGSYNDLSNKPTIPTVNNATLTIQKNGTTVKTFTANASSNVTANITVPTKVSELTNDSGFLTSHQDLSGYVPRSGGAVMTGDNLARTDNNSLLKVCGGTENGNGGTIALYGKDSPNFTGTVVLQPSLSSSSFYNFILYPDGTATWGSKNLAMQEDTVPRSGGSVLTGVALGRTDDARFFELNGGSGWNHGAGISLRGKDCNTYSDAGYFHILASDGTYTKSLSGGPDGTLTWDSKNLAMKEDTVPRSGGAVITGNLAKVNDTSILTIIGAPAENMGALINLYGKNQGTSLQGAYLLQAYNDIDGNYRYFVGYPDGTLTWFGQPIQYTSDQRLKQQISEIDDKLLDAWEDVEPVQFKYNDAVDTKKDKARLHTGYVVQQIDEACKSHGVDVSKYGLYCHEEYPEETEEVEVEQADGTKTKERKVIREASEHYSLRYTEVYAIECAYLRKRIKELEERLEKLEAK